MFEKLASVLRSGKCAVLEPDGQGGMKMGDIFDSLEHGRAYFAGLDGYDGPEPLPVYILISQEGCEA